MVDFSWNSRKSFRVLFESQAVFRLHRQTRKEIQFRQKTVKGRLLDISIGGCAIESSAYLPKDAKWNIFLDRKQFMVESSESPKKTNYSRIVGVVRVSRQLSNKKYRLGIQFEKISKEDRVLIDKFVEYHDRRGDRRISLPPGK